MTPLSVALRKRLRQLRGEEGFGLVELMVAFVILNVAVLGMAAAAGTTLRSLGTSKDRQAAVTLATSALEAARNLPYNELAMSGFADTQKYDFETENDAVTGSCVASRHRGHAGWCGELMVVRAGGVIAANTVPYRFTSGALTVKTRVSWACVAADVAEPNKSCSKAASNVTTADMSQYSKRITVVVTSSTSPSMKVKQTTLVSQAVRGLAGAQFSMFPSTGDSLSAPNTDETCFGHSLKNTGSNDAYEFVFPTTAGYTYKAYLDLGQRGVSDVADQQLTDLTGNGHPNTQPLATGTTIYVLVCYQPTSAPADGTTLPMQTVVRSGYDNTISRTLTHTLVYATTLRLHLAHMNDLLNHGDPQVQKSGVFEFKVATPDRVTLVDYDTDSRLGKRVERDKWDITNPGHMDWAVFFERKFARPTTFTTSAQLVIWTSSREALDKFNSGSGTSDKGLVFDYRLRRLDENGAVLADSGWIHDAYTHDFRFANQAAYPLFQQRSIPLSMAAPGLATFDTGDRLELILHCSDEDWKPAAITYKAEDHCGFAYDTTSFPAYLQVGLQ